MRRRFGYWLIIITVGVAAGAAGYLFALKHDNQKIKDLQSTIAGMQSTQPKKQPTANSKSSSFAEITPFSVKFPYADKPSGLGYTDTDADTVAFDSETLSDFANKLDPKNSCGLEATPGPLGFLSRTRNLPLTDASPENNGLVKQIGSYYYVYTHPKDCSTNSNVLKEQTSEANALIDDLKTLQAY